MNNLELFVYFFDCYLLMFIMFFNFYFFVVDNLQVFFEFFCENFFIVVCQDEYGYFFVYVVVSYNYFDFFWSLINEFKVLVDIKDEDGEIVLFVVEIVEVVCILVEELKFDIKIINDEG